MGQEFRTGIDVSVIHSPTVFRSGGRNHLSYELRLFNRTTADVVVKSVTAIAGKSTRKYEGEELKGISTTNDTKFPNVPSRDGAVLKVDLELGAETPREVFHRVSCLVTLPDQSPKEIEFNHKVYKVDTNRPIVIGSPLKGGPWAALNSYSPTSIHRGATMTINGEMCTAQRYAIDFVKIGPDGMCWKGDNKLNANWYGYGEELLAVANGTVRLVKDGIPENVPLSPERAVAVDLDTAAGNHVLLEIAPTSFVTYAHLQPGSVKVRVGDEVKKGQVLGRLGNSGNSDAPHLHMHLSDRPLVFGSQGVPYYFRAFDWFDGKSASWPLLGGVAWKSDGKTGRLVRSELPYEGDIVSFR